MEFDDGCTTNSNDLCGFRVNVCGWIGAAATAGMDKRYVKSRCTTMPLEDQA
jgi:hypothetical protein